MKCIKISYLIIFNQDDRCKIKRKNDKLKASKNKLYACEKNGIERVFFFCHEFTSYKLKMWHSQTKP
jgi:hypothetical protein